MSRSHDWKTVMLTQDMLRPSAGWHNIGALPGRPPIDALLTRCRMKPLQNIMYCEDDVAIDQMGCDVGQADGYCAGHPGERGGRGRNT